MEEGLLIKNLKLNKENAYVDLMNLYGDRLLRISYLILKDEKEAEDVVQETFLRIFKNIKGFRGDSSLYTWIYRISQNIIKDRIKKIDNTYYEDIPHMHTTEEIIIKHIDRNLLRNGIDKLSYIYKQVIVLFYFEDLSIREIAEILEEKEGTVKSKLSRGRRLLKEDLERGGYYHE